MSEMAKSEGGADAPTDDPTLSAETSKKLLNSIRNAFAGQVTTKEAGRKDGADHVLATVPVRPLMTAIVNGLRPIAKELPGGEKELPTEKEPEGRSQQQGHGRLRGQGQRTQRRHGGPDRIRHQAQEEAGRSG